MLIRSSEMERRNLFEEDRQLEALAEFNTLSRMKDVVDWGRFQPILEEVFGPPRRGGRGRPSWDQLIMLRALLLGVMYSLSDRQLQYMLLDRTSFKQFVGLQSKDQVPDQKTLWKYRDQLAQAGAIDALFEVFKEQLREHGYQCQTGTVVDATMVPVPRQRNSRDENGEIKNGRIPSEWEEDPNKLRQKDTDARWTKKRGHTFFGYKNHIAMDRETKLIEQWETTAASVHDSRMLVPLLAAWPSGDPQLWADSAYRSKAMVQLLRARGFKPRINFKAKRGQKLNARQVVLNQAYSRHRCRVEHVFGSMRNDMPEHVMRCIGEVRARSWIGMRNLCYNIKRLCYLETVAKV